ncbi:hypothetical protein R1sor_017429 [Riccia sorocarpa]|uniref:PWI domain-containing protein n=1 Tax=Riccia sorocarpa TaxID=122646 RepID=A0ABD3I6V8_9MARC
MSGGFFRGTSADQDTRFSNKMSKLLKTQKFAPELDAIIEMSKVKMDVIKPWIATRVTELLGFEDEVLINFIYGLLDVKEADGKHLQIQLTGFMEKNTVRFMKELWGLLTSAQNNISGIPQQFLDAKAEEAKKKKDEKERILSEVQRKKEEQEKDAEERREQERLRQLSAPQETTKRSTSASPGRRGDGEGGRKGRGLRRSSASPRGSRSPSSSPSRSPRRRRRSRSISRSPRRRRRSGSPYRRRSPIRPRSPFRRRRSPAYSRSPPSRRRKSPPPRSPPRYRSRTPPRIRRRSPLDGRSPPPRHGGGPRSPPLRRRSPSGSLSPPVARRSPSRSPLLRGKSPSRDRTGRRSRSPFQRRKSPVRHRGSRPSRSPPYQRRRSQSRDREFGGPGDRRRRTPSPSRDHGGGRRNGFDARDRERPARDEERLERRNDRGEKRDHSDQRLPHNREQERGLSRNGRDSRPSDSLVTGEKRTNNDLEEEVEELGTTKRDEPDPQDAETERRGNKLASRIRGQADDAGTGIEEIKRSRERKESVAEPAAVPIDEDHEPAPRPQKGTAGAKDVTDVPEEEGGSESPRSSEGRHEAKRRRKEEKRVRKEEKRRKREEKHRRKEEKRAAKSSKAGVHEDDDREVLDGRSLKEGDEQRGSGDVFGPREVPRKKDHETEDEQKRIEKELRNKALESLRAKKGVAC